MSAVTVNTPYPTFTDIDGQPLEDGYVWIGVSGLEPQANPQTAYWDAALTLTVTQPVRTRGGYPLNGTAIGRLYTGSPYSIKVQNKNSSTIVLDLTGAAGSGVGSISFGTTGLTPAVATDGDVVVAGTLAVANGGTGVTTATGTGSVVRATSPTVTGPTVSSGNLAFSSTAQRITGDFTNATWANRLAFQTSTVNGNTSVPVLPNGTGTSSQIALFGNSDPTNASYAQLVQIGVTETRLSAAIQGAGTYTPLTFYTGGFERVRVDTSGNVGIGTASPVNKVDVSGGNFGFRAAAQARFYRPDNGNYAIIDNPSNYLRLSQSGGDDVIVTTSGNVGIGTASPSGNLQVSAGNARVRFSNTAGTASTLLFGADSGQVFLGAETNAPIYFITNNTERLRIDSSGNINVATLGARITADFSNATLTNRVAFQTSTANSATSVTALPNGSSTDSNFTVSANSDPTNASVGQLRASSSAVVVASTRTGSGTYLPLQFQTSGGVAMSIDTGINVIQGVSALSTTATAGFLWITSCAGIPTGAPTAPYTNAAAMVCDTTNNRLYVRVGSTWRYTTLT
jgi:hypothetical protein